MHVTHLRVLVLIRVDAPKMILTVIRRVHAEGFRGGAAPGKQGSCPETKCRCCAPNGSPGGDDDDEKDNQALLAAAVMKESDANRRWRTQPSS